jgi:probable addiction module antidote protein
METKMEFYDVGESCRLLKRQLPTNLEACIQVSYGDVSFIAKALGDIARAKWMTQVSRESGLFWEGLYKALSGDRSSRFATILKVISEAVCKEM